MLSDTEDCRLVNVPGTQLLSDRGRVDSVAIDEARELKRGTGKDSHIILIPQPSDDPLDPYVIRYVSRALSLILVQYKS